MTIPHRFQTEKSGRKQKTAFKIVWTVLIHGPASDKSVFNAFPGDVSNRKLGFLEPFSHFWPFLATFWRINISERHYKRNRKKKQLFGGKTTVRRVREIAPLINQAIKSSYCVTQWANQKQGIDWTSSAVHGKGFRRGGLTDPWGREDIVRICLFRSIYLSLRSFKVPSLIRDT